ncbi:coiled-coil domain-containing protein 74B isoform X3 [Hoplias malabaricus]|uniref:coiled-coil domain-containing protein 74B isoform X3 n=1 Tax=Hoplias malabaricus TaxID=27720 RepID=UPI0034630E4A
MDAVVISLEKKIDFLQQQHRETLRELHSEIERLSRQNKDLHFKLIMEPLPSRRKGSSYKGQKHGTESNTFKSQNVVYLQQELEDKDLPQDAILCQAQHNDDTSETLVAGKPEFIPELKGGLITSLNPLRIHCNPSHPPRAPTLPECEVIIRQLYNANSLQSQEILRIKAVLRDIIFNRRITPENYILTKAYLADDKRVEEPERFPKLPGRALPRGKPMYQASKPEKMLLPRLKQSLTTNFAERQRRTRAVQNTSIHICETHPATQKLKFFLFFINTGFHKCVVN